MATTSTKSLEQLKAEKKAFEDAGTWNPSGSKKQGKIEDAIKVLEPEKYGAETVASAKQKLANSTVPLGTSTDGLGMGTGFGTSSGSGSSVNLNSIYQSALNDPKLLSLQDELNKKKQARDEAVAGENNNPFYTEATRVGKINSINEKANAEINTLSDQISEMKADAQIKVNIANQQYNIDDNNYKNQLQKLNLLISSGAITNASSSDIASISQATGLTTSMVKGIIAKAKEDSIPSNVITSTDDNGNVTVSVINTKTGQVIAQNSLGNVGNATNGSGGGSKVTDKDVGVAISLLREQDDINNGEPDKLLSDWEIQSAYDNLLTKYGNPDTALDLLESAMSKGGFSRWTN